MGHSFVVRTLSKNEWPTQLKEIADPPQKLYIRGALPSTNVKYLAVVGSREYTPYGKQMCERLITGLVGYPIVIVSGLALGIDGIAHTAALDAGLVTLAIPGSGIDDRVLYPATHRVLASKILEAGGALLNEFDPLWKPRKESFPQRNRIMAGIAHAVLVIEATTRSGTLITARLASDYNRDVGAVAGPIHSATSAGPHMLIKNGAALIESSADILQLLSISEHERGTSSSPVVLTGCEKELCVLLQTPLDRDTLISLSQMPASDINAIIASLELRGIVEEKLGLLHMRVPILT